MALPFESTLNARFPAGRRLRQRLFSGLAWGGRDVFALVPAFASLLSPCAVAQSTAAKTNSPVATGTLVHAAPWILDGEEHDGGFGDVVAGVGDVNGDGFADVLIAAPRYDGECGRVFVFHGSTNGVGRVPAWELRGEEPGDQLGYGAAAAGDVNGDGYADLLVATLGHRPGGIERNVTVAIYAGSPSGLRTHALWTIRDGENRYGCTVGTAGDVNRDGFADVFVSWLKPPPTATPHRGLFVFYGSPAGPGLAPNWRIAETGPDLKPSLGASAAAAGDVNGDGYDDLLVGARDASGVYPHAGKAFLFLGSASGLSAEPAWEATFDLPRRILMDPNGVMLFGSFLAGADDLNHDGFGDVAVAAPYADHRDSDEGMVFVYHGSKQGLSSRPNRVIEANRPHAVLGYSVARVGDVDGDGYADLAVGAPWATLEQHSEGAVAVFRGRPDGLRADPDWSVRGQASEARLGKVVAGAGDVDGDGFRDLLVSVPGHRSAGGTVGRVLVYYGSSDGITGSQGWRMTKPWGTRLVEGFLDATVPLRWVLILASLTGVGLAAYITGRLFERHRQAVIAGERADMQKQERSRIAQDLHDDLGPRLTQLGWRVSREKESGQGAVNLEQMESATHEMSLSLRQIIWSLDPEQDTLEDLVVNLGQYADQFLEGTNLPCRRDLPLELPDRKLPPHVRRQIFLAVKEALNNAVKHARASEIWLRARWDNPMLTLIIEDNGVGLPNSLDALKGHGLVNMQRRLAEIGGEARLENQAGGGTRVVLRIRLTPPGEQSRRADRA